MTKSDIIFNRFDKVQNFISKISPDVIHSHGIQADYILSKISSKGLKVSTIHSNYKEDYNEQFWPIVSKMLEKWHYSMHKKIDINVCCSESVYFEAVKHINNCIFIRNGIDVNLFSGKKLLKRSEIGVPRDATVYLYLGRLIRRKKVPELLTLFKKSCNEKDILIIAGDGNEYDKCKSLANKQVKFVGYVNNPRDYLRISDVYISNSSSEGLSMSVLEAIASGNKLLLSNILSHRECLKMSEKDTGYTFNEENFLAKKKLVDKLVKAKTKVDENTLYSISAKRMANEYEQIYVRKESET
ncbi:glycosyltransferase [Candidatus Saccharibacteria bacterium]|nr:glycosyltransferase [Candidatus Saccharibacteria bacterium]